MTEPALEARSLCKNFGALQVTNNINFALPPGARHALIGPNGAGKTTLINLLTGALPATSGSVLIGGRDVSKLAEAQRVKQGIARTFQINTLFQGLTVLENLCLPVSERIGASRSLWMPMGKRADVIEEAHSLLHLLHLEEDAEKLVRELPYGRQRLVEIAIALGLQPKVLLLDEPAAGVPSSETGILLDAIADLPDDIAVLIIEHDMDVVFRFADRITVLVSGEILTEGTPDEIAADPHVQSVYLGSEGAPAART